MKISIIIPTYNEEDSIGKLIRHLQANGNPSVVEIIVSDAGSRDGTLEEARKAGASGLRSPCKGRAAQMNYAAQHASGNILYFVHADSYPPDSYVEDIRSHIKKGFHSGTYRFRFMSSHTLLKINSWFTRFNLLFCRGGDQTLFIRKDRFTEIGGFDEEFVIMEDYELLKKIRKTKGFKLIQKDVKVSARKYEDNHYLKVNLANFIVFSMYRMGVSPMKLHKTYQMLIDHPKKVKFEKQKN